MASRLPIEWVELRAEHDRALKIRVWLGEGSPQVTGGVGGWDAVARPGRRPLSVWRGPTEPLRQVIPLLFDGWAHGKGPEGSSMEADIRVLEKMGGLDRGDPKPPAIIIEGSLPHDESRAPGNRWVVETLEWGEAIRRTSDGHRVRQACLATFMLYTESNLSAIKRAKPRPKYRVVSAHTGDTYEKIAARELKLRRAGNRLARLNGSRDAGKRLKRGTKVRLPTAKALADWKHDLKR